MNLDVMTLWDALRFRRRRAPSVRPAHARAALQTQRARPAQERYDALVEEMKQRFGVRVRKWRTSMSGVAWTVTYHDGRIVRLIESPYPRGPMSCAVFLHEVGHHAIGLGIHKPRCVEELRAWQWALAAMRHGGFTITPSVEKRFERSMRYAVAKAQRRGLKRLPAELAAFDSARTPAAGHRA